VGHCFFGRLTSNPSQAVTTTCLTAKTFNLLNRRFSSDLIAPYITGLKVAALWRVGKNLTLI
jgi:hypothetical protein